MGVVKFCDHVNGGRVTTSLTYTPVKFWKSHAYDGLLMLMTIISGEEPLLHKFIRRALATG